MILRELIARYDLRFDDKGFRRADSAINRTFGVLKGLGGLLAAGTVFMGFKKLVSLGSDAAETLNVLNEVFKHNSEDVQQWARDTGQAIGRSQYQLRELAGGIGAVLSPLMDNNADAATRMSKGLTQLAVDLGSFYNRTDDEALVALRAAITGEAEPMKRFGVVMLEATLQAYALDQGIKKQVKDMTIAEKTQLRYEFLMAKTTAAQGDALRTANGYANAIKGVKGALRDVATNMMLQAMPAISGFTSKVRDWLRDFAKVIEKTNATKAALIVLGGVAAAVGVSMLLPWLPLIVLIGAAIIVVDEFITLFEGGETVIGNFLDTVGGLGTAQEYVDSFREGVKILREHIDAAGGAMTAFGADVHRVVSKVGEWFDGVTEKIREFFGWFERFESVKGKGEVGTSLAERVGKLWKTTAQKGLRLAPGTGQMIMAYEGLENFVGHIPGAGDELRGRQHETAQGRGIGAGVFEGPTFGRANMSRVIPAPAAGGKTSKTVNQHNKIDLKVEVPANANAGQVAHASEKALKRVLDDQKSALKSVE